MASQTPKEIITFKVDKSLRKLLKGVNNRSEFIRNAVLFALNNICPLCHGTGVMSEHQKEHWDEFSSKHKTKECRKCDGPVLLCER